MVLPKELLEVFEALVAIKRCARGNAAKLRGVLRQAESLKQGANHKCDLGSLRAPVGVKLVDDEREDVASLDLSHAAVVSNIGRSISRISITLSIE